MMEGRKAQARRGYVPDDERWFSPEGIRTMRKAAEHIFYLVNEGYGIEQAATFTGNHFQLSARQRTALMRMICSRDALRARMAEAADSVQDKTVWIDGFNQIITLETYLQHGTLIQGFDHCIKDLAGLRGSYHLIPETGKAAELMLKDLKEKQAGGIHVLLDRNVSNSGRLLAVIAEEAEKLSLPVRVHIEGHVDQLLKEKDLCITTDSIILSQGKTWYNLLEDIIPESSIRFRLNVEDFEHIKAG